MNGLRHTVVLAALVLTGASARAQGPRPSGVGIPHASAARAGLDRSAGQLASPLPLAPAAAEEKNPTVAGALSFLIPGAGSFYAGAPGHGVLHLLVAVGAATVVIVGSTACVLDAMGGEDCNDTVIDTAFAVYVGNWAWSIFTAASDARANNRRQGR